MLGLCRFYLHFSELQNFFMFQTFSMFQKKLRKSLGHKKVSILVFFTNTNFKKTRQKQQSPNIFLCFSEKNIEKAWVQKRTGQFLRVFKV